LDDEIDLLPSEAGVKDEKHTSNDLVFRVRISGEEVPVGVACLGKVLTVNTEMQNKTSGLGYDLISRAIYYGASLLRDTVPAGDSMYKGIHKVYSIWLCNEPLQDIWLRDELKERSVHTYSMWRGYDSWKYLYKDKQADLMQIVMVELPKLRETDGAEAEMMYKLFNETQNIVSEIEKKTGVKLLEARRGVKDMVDYETVIKDYETVIRDREAVIRDREAVIKDERAKAVRNIVESWYSFNQDYTATRAFVLRKYPDIDAKLLEDIISEIYGLQQV